MEQYEMQAYHANDPAGDAQRQQLTLQDHAAAQPQIPQHGSLKSWFDFESPGYLKGLLIGAGVAVVLGHPAVRKAIISGAVNAWDSVSGGVEELKEQIRDARAEKNGKDN